MTNVIELDCKEQKIEKVIVYSTDRNRAEIERKINAELVPGLNEIQIINISDQTVNGSLRVDGKGEAMILDNQVKEKKITRKEKDLEKFEELNSERLKKKKEIDALKDQKTMISSRIETLQKLHAKVKSSNEGEVKENPLLSDEVMKSYDNFTHFYEERWLEAQASLRDLEREISEAEEEQSELQKATRKAYEKEEVTVKMFSILLEAEKSGPVELEITYQVKGAGWTSSYNIRIDTLSSTPAMKIVYSGEISQSSGEDWNKVPLVLSTAPSNDANTLPTLGPLEATFWKKPEPKEPKPHLAPNSGLRMGMTAPRENRNDYMCGFSARKLPEFGPPLREVVARHVQEQLLSTEFTITRPAVIPSSSEKHKVTIGIVNLKPQLVYECVPKRRCSAFLTAAAVNESQMPFLKGKASVFLNGSFMSMIDLKTISPGELFTCSLGIDPGMKVTYKPVKTSETRSLVSTFYTEQAINIRNTRNFDALLTIREQIPKSNSDKINVHLIHPENVTISEETATEGSEIRSPGVQITQDNILEWTVKLASGDVQDLVVRHKIEYPLEERLRFQG